MSAASGADCDAFVARSTEGGASWCVVKRTFAWVGDRLQRAEPRPLRGLPGRPDAALPLAPGTDLRPGLRGVDVVVHGSAHAPRGAPVRSMEVGLSVADRTRRVAVFGDRRLRRVGRRVQVSGPRAFEAMPLTWDRAYGGVDARVAVPGPPKVKTLLALMTDHPGACPWNPFGRGWALDGMDGDLDLELPNLEDPDHLLAHAGWLVTDPAAWWRRPAAACLAPMPPLCFPRCSLVGAHPWHPPGEAAWWAAEARGRLAEGWRRDPRAAFLQEGTGGLVLPELPAGTMISAFGVLPDRPSGRFAMPGQPEVTLRSGSSRWPVAVRPQRVALSPDEGVVEVTWGGRSTLPAPSWAGVRDPDPVHLHVDGREVARA